RGEGEVNAAEPLKQREQEAGTRLQEELRQHLSLASRTYNLGMEAIDLVRGHVRAYRPSAGARLALLAKLLSDLRAATVIALHGYPTQAAVIGSSLYETAMTATCLGTDDALAQEWSEHGRTKPTELFRNVWTLTEEVVRRFGSEDVDAVTATRY